MVRAGLSEQVTMDLGCEGWNVKSLGAGAGIPGAGDARWKAERLCSQEEAGYLVQSEGGQEKKPVLGLLAWQGCVLRSSGPGSP